jgi:hypothetical protein
LSLILSKFLCRVQRWSWRPIHLHWSSDMTQGSLVASACRYPSKHVMKYSDHGGASRTSRAPHRCTTSFSRLRSPPRSRPCFSTAFTIATTAIMPSSCADIRTYASILPPATAISMSTRGRRDRDDARKRARERAVPIPERSRIRPSSRERRKEGLRMRSLHWASLGGLFYRTKEELNQMLIQFSK